MPAKPLSPEQLEDAQRLRAAFESAKKRRGLTQATLAEACGWNTQGAVSQYLLGKIPLNWPALVKLSRALKVEPAEISPTLAKDLGPATASGTSEAPAQAILDVETFLRVYREVPDDKKRDLIDLIADFGRHYGQADRTAAANDHT